MGNEIGYYFGPYLKIEVRGILREDWQRICVNRHRVSHEKFCPECGEIANSECFTKQGKATLYDIFQDNEHYDYLSDKTQENMRKEGKYIIAVDNTGNVEQWLYLDRFSFEVETLPFPTEAEQSQMRDSFLKVHGERIATSCIAFSQD